jgi:hypothetical protein
VFAAETGTTKKGVAGGVPSLDPEKWPSLQQADTEDADAYLEAEAAATTELIEALLEHRQVCNTCDDASATIFDMQASPWESIHRRI